MAHPAMPTPREFGWVLKPTSSTHFAINKRPNGQFSVVLNHALLRGCTAEMIHWWFLHFANLRVRLVDTPGYGDAPTPGYLLWHPSDHVDATLKGRLRPDGTAQAGASIHIREAMQYLAFGWRYPVDATLEIFYCEGDGWAMGRKIPFFGPAMCLRIHFKDVEDAGRHVGVHYHYEVVIGVSADNAAGRFVNKRLAGHYGPEFFEAWHTHNAIEVGVFENFLPALYDQRRNLGALHYAPEMTPPLTPSSEQTGYDAEVFRRRVAGFASAEDPYRYQGYADASFL